MRWCFGNQIQSLQIYLLLSLLLRRKIVAIFYSATVVVFSLFLTPIINNQSTAESSAIDDKIDTSMFDIEQKSGNRINVQASIT